MKRNQKSPRKLLSCSAARRTLRQALRPALPELLESRLLMSSYSVTSTADGGSGSLRQALINLQQDNTPATIDFSIAGSGVQTISLTSPLPAISVPVTIDGSSQGGPGYGGPPLIELNGANAGAASPGLDFEAGAAGSVVNGLTIDSFSGAGVVLNSGGVTLSGNYIGTNPTGSYPGLNASGYFDMANHDGVDIHSNDNTLSGNLISGNDYTGVWISGDGNTLTANFIGTDATGEVAVPNSLKGSNVESGGVVVDHATNTTVGGPAAADRNVISGNDQDGIVFSNDTGSANLVEGNAIGLDFSGRNAVVFNAGINSYTGNNGDGIDLGTFHELAVSNVLIENNVISANQAEGIYLSGASSNTIAGNIIGLGADGAEQTDGSGNLLGNAGDGITIDVDSSANTIGGLTAADRNVIGGNMGNAVSINSAGGALPNVLEGNYMGTDASGFVADPSTDDIYVSGGMAIIGGAAPGAGNVISGAYGYGIALVGGSSKVYGNMIGTGPDGETPVPNYDDGVRIVGSSNNVIGGDQSGQGNIIAFNGRNGVNLLTGANGAVNNAVEGNSIFGNAHIGIDLGNDGPTPNGTRGAAGPNNYQFFPVLDTSVANDGTTATVTGTMTGPVGAVYVIDFYTDPTADPTGYGQGRTFMGSEQVTIGSDGTTPVSFSGHTPQGTVWTATATDSAGNTSEFALDVIVGQAISQPNSISGVVTTDLTGNGLSADDTPLAGITVDLFENGGTTPIATTVSASDGTYSFTHLSAGSYVVQEQVPGGWTETGGASGYSFVASNGVNSTGNNFANFQDMSVNGTVYTDLSGNGFSSEDTPMNGVTVNLFQDGGSSPVATATTGADGAYSFTHLGPGLYSVQEVTPAGYTVTQGAGGYTVATVSGQNLSGDDFDNYLPPSASISGYVFCDDNLDGVFDSTTQDGVALPESGGQYATVTLTGTTTTGLAVSTSATADAYGHYQFGGLAAGTYTVSLTGYSPDHQAEQTHGGVLVSQATSLTLAPGQQISGIPQGASATNNGLDFAEIAPGGLQGFVWDDANNDGNIDFNEAGIVNVTITLSGVTYAGATVTQTNVTDSTGEYIFTNLLPGTYTLTESTPGGFTDGKDMVGSLGGSETYLSSSPSTSGCSTGQTNCASKCNNSCGNWSYNDCYSNYNYNCFSYNCDQRNNCGNYGLSNCGWSSGCSNAQNTFSNIQIGGCEDIGLGYNFGETGGKLGGCQTDTATLAFWHNRNGQTLLGSLNGGASSTALGTWLANMFPNLYGSGAKVNFSKMTNAQIAAFYNSNDFNVSGLKLDAAVLSAALSSYVTNTTWAGGNYAVKYGFTVSAQGVGYDSINVGSDGAAFGVANNSNITILQALDATNQLSSGDNGVLYGGNTALRSEAYAIYAAVAQNGLTA